MRFEDAYEGWTEERLTQIDAARLLGVCPALFAAPSTDTRKTAWTADR